MQTKSKLSMSVEKAKLEQPPPKKQEIQGESDYQVLLAHAVSVSVHISNVSVYNLLM